MLGLTPTCMSDLVEREHPPPKKKIGWNSLCLCEIIYSMRVAYLQSWCALKRSASRRDCDSLLRALAAPD